MLDNIFFLFAVFICSYRNYSEYFETYSSLLFIESLESEAHVTSHIYENIDVIFNQQNKTASMVLKTATRGK